MKTLLLLVVLVSWGASAHADLSKSDLAEIHRLCEVDRHTFRRSADGEYMARNDGQGWNVTVDALGFIVRSDSGGEWGLESLPGKAEPGTAAVAGNTIARPLAPGLTEWFIHDARGLEQGWIVSRPLEDNAIILGLRGADAVTVREDAVQFASGAQYAGLKAWDANGDTVKVWFESRSDGIAVCYDDAGALYPLTIDPIFLLSLLKASNTQASDGFGESVAISGDTVVVGAPQEDSSATGVNGNQGDNTAGGSGAAYVYVRTGGIWTQQAYLKASNTGGSDGFGSAVAVDGNTIVIGAPSEGSSATGVNGNELDNSLAGAGAAYVFVRSGTVWTQQAYLKASNTGGSDNFGIAVAVSGDTVVVTASEEDSNASGINGNQSNNLAPNSGAAYVFQRTGTTWAQQAYLKASNPDEDDFFGKTAALAGNDLIVGAESERSSATGVNGNQIDNSFSNAGAAYIFVRAGSTWSQQAYLKASNTGIGDFFGASVAIDGHTALVGADGEASNATGVNGNQANNSLASAGAVYVFVRSGTTWSQQAYLKASNPGSNDAFGFRVALSGHLVLVGAGNEDSNGSSEADNSLSNAGAAYVFARTGTLWTQRGYLKAFSIDSQDRFGGRLALSGDQAVIGALGESSNLTGVVFPSPDNSALGSGGAYLWQIGETMTGIAKAGVSAPGGTDLVHGKPVATTLGTGSGEVLLQTGLTGAGAPSGKNTALFSSIGNFDARMDLVLQTGTVLGSMMGLPANAKVTSVFNPLKNNGTLGGLFQAKVSGTGITSQSDTLLMLDNGTFVSPILRTGSTIAALSGAQMAGIREVVEAGEFAVPSVAVSYTLKQGGGLVSARDDTGILIVNHTGATLSATAREGQAEYGGSGFFGQFQGRAALGTGGNVAFIAKHLPSGGGAFDAAYVNGPVPERSAVRQGDPAPGGAIGETVGTLLGVGRFFNKGMVRGFIKGAPSATNEAIWELDGPAIRVRKGQDIGGGAFISRFNRVWGTFSRQLFAHVTLAGGGANSKNNQALLLVQSDSSILVLMRTGDPAPGFNNPNIKISALQAIDVDTSNMTYVILAALTGVPSRSNQAVWWGRTSIGDDGAAKERRLPELMLQKGTRYSTAGTPSDTIRSISLKPVPDTTGVSGRGLAQQINGNGDFVLTLTGERGAQEVVKVSP